MKNSHTKQVLLSTTQLFASQTLIGLFSSGFIIFLAHVLPKNDFANLAVFGILSSLIIMAVNAGLETSCIQRVPDLIAKGDHNEASAMLKTTFLNRVFLSALLSLLVYVFSASVSQLFMKNTEYVNIIKAMSLGLLFSSLLDSLGLLAQVTQQFGKISLIRLVVQTSSGISAIALYFAFGLQGYIIGYTWTPIIGVILYVLILRKFLFNRSGFYPWWQLAKYSAPFYLRGFVRFGLMRFDQFLIGVFLQPSALATYFIAKQFSESIFTISNAISDPVLIKICELKKEGLKRVHGTFRKVSRYYSYVFVPLCFGIASTSYFLLHLYGGYQYTDGVFVLVILSLGMMMYCLSYPYSMGVLILGKPKESLKLHSMGGITNMAFAIVTVPTFGAVGMAVAKFLSFASFLFYGRHLLRNIIAAKFDKGALKHSLIASFGMGFVIVSLQLIYYNIVTVPFYALLGCFVFMSMFCRALEQKDIAIIEEILPHRFKNLIVIFYGFGARVAVASTVARATNTKVCENK